MKWIKDSAGLFGLGILLSGVFLYGLSTQQKIMDVRFEAVSDRFEAVSDRFEVVDKDIQELKTDIQELKTDISRLEVQLNQFIISLVGKKKAIILKKQAEDLLAKSSLPSRSSDKTQVQTK